MSLQAETVQFVMTHSFNIVDKVQQPKATNGEKCNLEAEESIGIRDGSTLGAPVKKLGMLHQQPETDSNLML